MDMGHHETAGGHQWLQQHQCHLSNTMSIQAVYQFKQIAAQR